LIKRFHNVEWIPNQIHLQILLQYKNIRMLQKCFSWYPNSGQFIETFSQCTRDRFNKRHNGKSSSWRTTQSKSKVLWWTAANATETETATAVVQSAQYRAASQCTTAILLVAQVVAVVVVVPHEWHTFNGCTSLTFILGVCPTFDFKCNLCTCHSASW